MKVGIIGAGFTGLAAAYKLSKEHDQVFLFEKEDAVGGLANGFKDEKWRWGLEKHYHHFFTSDWVVRSLAKEVGQEVIFKRPLTSTYYDGDLYQLDSPVSLLKFPRIPFIDRVRTGLTLGYLKYISSWKPLENFTSEKFIKTFMGNKSWEVLWEPLFGKKFDKYSSEISAPWFWARIKKRSYSLGYPVGGFQAFSELVIEGIKKNGGEVHLKSEVEKIYKSNHKISIKVDNNTFKFDRVICTLPSLMFEKLTDGFTSSYRTKLKKQDMIGTVDVILSLKYKFLRDGGYWLSVNDNSMPFITVVEHTNFMDKANYNNEHLLYVANYSDTSHPDYRYSDEKLISNYIPHLKKINPKFKKEDINRSWVFRDAFAQPIVTCNYSRQILSNSTPIKGLFLANMQQVYPWDRGVNYAVELGYQVANLVKSN